MVPNSRLRLAMPYLTAYLESVQTFGHRRCVGMLGCLQADELLGLGMIALQLMNQTSEHPSQKETRTKIGISRSSKCQLKPLNPLDISSYTTRVLISVSIINLNAQTHQLAESEIQNLETLNTNGFALVTLKGHQHFNATSRHKLKKQNLHCLHPSHASAATCISQFGMLSFPTASGF